MASDTQVLNIACAIDDSFVYPLNVMLTSTLENHKHKKLKIHLFSAALSEKSVHSFEKLISSYNQEFKFYKLEEKNFKGLPINERISYATYYRILIPEIIDIPGEKFLYLDSDVVVLKDLSPLFDIELKDKILASADDLAGVDSNLQLKHKIPEPYHYFNAGILLIDKNNWIAKNATQQVLDYLNKNKELCEFWDQDGLNGTLYKERISIPLTWNQQIALHFLKSAPLLRNYPKEYMEALYHPAIIHYNGREKPWHFACGHPLKKHFKEYASLNGQFYYTDKINFKKIIKRYMVYGLLGWKTLNKYYYYHNKQV